LIKIANANYIETGGLKSLRNQAGVIGRGRKSSGEIIRIANDQSDALLRRVGTPHGQVA
jgi:hypothetical protein